MDLCLIPRKNILIFTFENVHETHIQNSHHLQGRMKFPTQISPLLNFEGPVSWNVCRKWSTLTTEYRTRQISFRRILSILFSIKTHQLSVTKLRLRMNEHTWFGLNRKLFWPLTEIIQHFIFTTVIWNFFVL